MDIVRFIEERNRMCRSFDECEKCPAFNVCEDEICSCAVGIQSPMNAKDQVIIVEEWADAHPRKTRQSVFLEQHPKALIGQNGVLRLCPVYLSDSYRNKEGSCIDPDVQCTACRSKFWLQEVE